MKNKKSLIVSIKFSNKKGSHIGVVLSFVIFITFLTFLYSITEPLTKVERSKQNLLDYIEVELLKDFSEDMTSASVNIENHVGDNCIKLPLIDDGLQGINSIVKDEDEIILQSFLDSDDGIKVNRDSKYFLKIYYSNEFDNGGDIGGCVDLLDGFDYSIGSIRTTEHVFESNINNLTDYINLGVDNYAKVKSRFKIPLGDEFGFSFKNDNEEIIGTQEKNISASVYVEELPIQYIDSEANIKSGFVVIRVW